MRSGFGQGLLDAAAADPRIVGLCADLTESTGMLPFKQKFPSRFFELGVAEQNLVTVASGMAAMGKIPFASSYAIFSPGRNWEQIRTTICYNNVPVKIVSTHTGVNVGPDGGSHQALEDIALMRVLPRMTVVAPCDEYEAREAVTAMAKHDGPVYMRLTREKVPNIFGGEIHAGRFEIGKAVLLFEGAEMADGKIAHKSHESHKKDVAILTTGSMAHPCLLAAKHLAQHGKSVSVYHFPTVKPLDHVVLHKIAREFKTIVTAEEHQVAGGFGSAIAEHMSAHSPLPIEFVGVRDLFGQSGTAQELLEHYGLTAKDVYEAAHKVMLRVQ